MVKVCSETVLYILEIIIFNLLSLFSYVISGPHNYYKSYSLLTLRVVTTIIIIIMNTKTKDPGSFP